VLGTRSLLAAWSYTIGFPQSHSARASEAGELRPALVIRGANVGNLHALISQSIDKPGAFSFDGGPPLEFEADLAEDSMLPPTSWTKIPTLSIRLSAICPTYKVPS
jgi:hypothetical protein